MKILFFGSSSFSVPFLKALITKHEVAAVVTTPPKPKGRGLKTEPNEVQLFAEASSIPCQAPASLKKTPPREIFPDQKFDVSVVASYGKLLPKEWLDFPTRMSVNVHPSLLPKYRGAAPIQWQLLDGEKETGVSLFKMEEGMDSGPLLGQIRWPLGFDRNAETLTEELTQKGAPFLLETLDALGSGKAVLKDQDHSKATHARKIIREDGLINWKRTAAEIHNQVRALVTWPGAFSTWKQEQVKIISSSLDDGPVDFPDPGQFLGIAGEALRIRTGKGALLVRRIQPAGKREMSGREFAIGRRLEPGMSFGQ